MTSVSKFDSIQKSVKLCPNGVNIKLLIRHSIRPEVQEGISTAGVLLTEEGKILAEQFGERIEMEIGTFSSSCYGRCVQTCEHIITGYNKRHGEHFFEIQTSEQIRTPQNKDAKLSGETFKKLGISKVFDGFVSGVDMPGFYDLERGVKKILNYMFSTGNKPNTLDVFCTHDFQMAMVLLYLEGNTPIAKETLFSDDGWPKMLEGMYLWRNGNEINISWRGEIKIHAAE